MPQLIRCGSPLAAAARGGDILTTELLLAAGADILIRDPDCDISAVETAIVLGRTPALNALLRQGGDVNDRNKSTGQTALHVAVQFHRVGAIDALAEAGADTALKQKDGMKTLNEEAGNDCGRCETMLALLQRGANAHARDKYGLAPLHRLAVGSPRAPSSISCNDGGRMKSP